jgi:hypothetical protein
MKQSRNSCFSSTAACMALAFCGIGGFLGLGSTDNAQASPTVQSQSIASGNRVGASDYAVTLIGRGTPDTKRCPRSNDGCETNLPPKPPAPSAPPTQ